MKQIRKPSCTFLNRRGFCSSIAGWVVGVIFAKLPFATDQSLHVVNTDQEFFVINGWVLIREDFSGNKVMDHVVRL